MAVHPGADRRPATILFVDHAPAIGGAQLLLAGHVAQLDRERFTPVLATTEAVPALAERFLASGARVHLVPMDRLRSYHPAVPYRFLRAAWHLRRLIRRERAALVVSNTSRAAYVSAIAVQGTGVPLLSWVHDFQYSLRVFRVLRRAARGMLFVSRAVRDFYLPEGDRRAAVVPVGTSLHRRLAEVCPARRAAERARWGFSPDDVVLGFMGRLVDEKGPREALAALAELRATHPRARMLVVGSGRGQPGDVEDALRADVERLGLGGRVVFAGYQTDEALYYRLFDLFVHGSRVAEAYPTSLVQALMAGLPVVATSTGGTPEIVRDGETGLLVPPARPDALADAVRRLLDDPALAERLARTGRREVLQRNRDDVTAEQVQQVFESLLRNGARP